MLLEELRAHLPDQRTLFSGETMEQAVSSLWPRRAGCEVRRVRSKAVGTLLGGSAAVTIVVSLSAAFASCLSVACMSGMVVPAVLALLGGVGSFYQPGQSAGTKQAPRSFCWFKEGNDECFVRELFIVAARGSNADRRESRLMVDLVASSRVVVKFIPIKVGEPTRAVVYNVGVPFLAGLYGCGAEVFGPFCLALYEQVACELVYSAYGPPSIYLKDLRDSIQFNAGFASNVSAYGVAYMVPGGGVGVETDE